MKGHIRIYPLTLFSFLLFFCTSFKIAEQKTVTDYDGNVYHTVKIGKQTWMVENLKTTHYRNGDPIKYVQANKEWLEQATGAYCSYDNDSANARIYGRLYNRLAVDDKRGLAPRGWRIPSTDDWKILQEHLGGIKVSGGKLKEAGTSHFASPNTGATNSSGFTALPGGFRFYTGEFGSLGYSGVWWSAKLAGKPDNSYAETFRLFSYYEMSRNKHDYPESNGFSVRCIKDK